MKCKEIIRKIYTEKFNNLLVDIPQINKIKQNQTK